MTYVYYELLDDVERPNRWSLTRMRDAQGKVSPRAYVEGNLVPARPDLELDVEPAGDELDYTFGPFDIPIVKPWVVDLLRSFDDDAVQCERIHIRHVVGSFYIMNILALRECLDLSRSGRRLFWSDSELRDFPHREPGGLKLVMDPAIDVTRVGGAHLFRLAEYKQCVFVSAPLKDALEARNITGVTFRLATPPVS